MCRLPWSHSVFVMLTAPGGIDNSHLGASLVAKREAEQVGSRLSQCC